MTILKEALLEKKKQFIDKFFRLEHEDALIEFNKAIAGCYRDGNHEYDAVGALLITWKEDDMNCRELEVNGLEDVFKDKFNYRTESFQIPSFPLPSNESTDALLNRVDSFIKYYDSPSKLGIIYYGKRILLLLALQWDSWHHC